jgi:hypothetical protein
MSSHTSHLTPHTSHLTPHTSHLTPHTSHLTPHTSHLTRQAATDKDRSCVIPLHQRLRALKSLNSSSSSSSSATALSIFGSTTPNNPWSTSFLQEDIHPCQPPHNTPSENTPLRAPPLPVAEQAAAPCAGECALSGSRGRRSRRALSTRQGLRCCPWAGARYCACEPPHSSRHTRWIHLNTHWIRLTILCMCPGVGLREFVFDGVFGPKVTGVAESFHSGFTV